MQPVEYIAKITGDTSGLEKAIKRANGSLKTLSDDEVIIKLGYDGNVKGFNEEFSKIIKSCPDLTIQFQYNANQKMLKKELDKLQQLQDLKVDVNTGNAEKKISDMISDLQSAAQRNVGGDIIESKIKGIYKYANSITHLGGKISKDFANSIYDAVAGTKYEKTFDKLLSNVNVDNLKLFNFKKPIDEEISDVENRISEFKKYISELETKGASKSGLSSELQDVQEEIKILRSDLEDMKQELGTISGEQFNHLANDIKEVNEQLQIALDKIKTLSGENSLGNVINEWRKQDISKTNERYTAFDSRTMQTAGVNAAANAAGVSEKLIMSALDAMNGEADSFIHTHPEKHVAFSDDDIESFFKLYEQGIKNQLVASFDEVLSLDLSNVNLDYKDEILQHIRERFDDIENVEIYQNNIAKFLDSLKENVDKLMTFDEASTIPPDVVKDFQSNYKKFLSGFSDSFTGDDLFDGLEGVIKTTLAQSDTYSSASDELKKNIRIGLSSLSANLPQELNQYFQDAQQLGFQQELLSVFSDSKYLKDGIKSAIKLQNIDDFINEANAAGQRIGTGIVNGLRNGIDAHSDSKESEKAGQDFVNGLTHSIENHTDEAVSAAEKLGQEVSNKLKDSLMDNSVLEFYEKYGTPSQALDANYFSSVREVLDELGGEFKQIDEAADDFSEQKLNAKFLEDLTSQLQLSEESLIVIKASLKEIDAIAPGGEFAHLSSPVTNSKQILEHLEKIQSIADGTHIVTDEEVNSAKQLLQVAEEFDSKKSVQALDTSVNNLAEQAEEVRRLEEENEELRKSLRSTQDELSLMTERASEFENAWSDADWQSDKLDEELAAERQKLEAEQKITAELQQQNEELTKRNRELQEDNDMWQGAAQSHFDEELRLQKELVEEKAKNVASNKITEESARLTAEEAEAMSEVYEKAIKAAEAKETFANANKDVLESIIQSLAGLNAEGNGFSNLNKLISNLANNKDDRIQNMVINLTDLRDALSADVSGNSFISELTKLAEQGDALKDLATAIQATKTQLQNVKEAAVQEYTDAEIQELSQAYSDADAYLEREQEYLKQREQYLKEGDKQAKQVTKEYEHQVAVSEKYNKLVENANSSLASMKNKGGFTPEFVERIDSLISDLSGFDGIDLISEDERQQIDALLKDLKQLKSDKTLSSNKAANEKTISKGLGRINDILSSNTTRAFRTSELHDAFVKLQQDFLNFKTDRPEAEAKELMDALLKLEAQFKGLDDSVKGRGFLGNIGHRLADMNAKFIAQYFSIQDWIRYIRQAATAVMDLDKQMVELSKVSGQALPQIKADFQSYADTAKDLGATISDTISATADWARLGYSVPDAKELARVALLYKNVGDGIDITAANESLISTLQGFQMQADEAEHIVDVFNEVANNYAIDTAGIGEALQRSAASLNAANTSLEQSVSLITAANTVVQDPDSVGTTFKTLSARIRGAKTELEDLGEEADEFTETTSKLQGLVKSLTGFDILESDQKTFKSIYDILIGIGKEWNNLSDIEQASLGEALAGKRNANTLYAILDNIDTLEAAYVTASDSAGSAMQEQQHYEEGLEYSTNRLKASLEELAADVLNSDFLKGAIDAVNNLVQLFDKLISQVGALPTLIGALGGFAGGKIGLFSGSSLGLMFGGKLLDTNKSNKAYRKQLTELSDVLGLHQADKKVNTFSEDTWTHWLGGIDKVDSRTKELFEEYQKGGLTTEEAIGKIQTELSSVEKSTFKFTTGLKSFFTSLGAGLLNAVITGGITLIVSGVSKIVDKLIITKKEAESVASAFSTAASDMAKSQSEFGGRLSGYKDEFEELSRGVNSLGENINLTDEEFKRYREISDDIAQNMPGVIDLWNSQGEAVINLKNGLKDLTAEYQKNIQAQSAALLNKEDEDGLTYREGTIKNANDVLKRSKINSGYDEYQEITINEELDRMKALASKTYDEVKDIFKYGGGFEASWLEDAGFTYNTTEDEYVQSVHNALENQIDAIESDIDEATYRLSQYASTYSKSLPRYWEDLGEESRKYIDLFLSNLDYDFVDANFRDKNGKISENLINQYVTNLITTFDNLSDEDLKQITLRFDLETQFNNGEITSVGDYLAKLAEIDSWISTLPEETQKIIRILFDVGGEDSVKELREDTLKRMGGSSSRGSDFKRSGSKQILDFIDNDMSADELSLWNAALHDGKIPPDILAAGRESWNEYLKTLQQDADDNPLEIKASSAVDSMADAKTAFNSLDNLYDQVVNMNATNGQATGFADPSLINSVESAFSKFVDSSGDTEQLNNALESFEKTLVEVPNDSEAAQRAIDNLTTAYVDQTDIIKNLDDANAEWSVEQLKAMGITNAEQVVFSRLSEKAKKTAENIKTLSKAVKQNRDALDKAVSEGDASAEAFDNISDSVKNLLASYDEEGKIVLPEIDNQFILDNFADIEAAIAGDIDAINRLRVEAAKGISVNVALQDQSFFDASNELLSMIAQLDANDFTVDGYMNNADVLNKLAEMNAAFKGTAAEFARYISQITGGAIQAKVEYETIDVGNMTGYEAAQKMGYSGNAATQFGRAVDRGAVTKIRIPKVVNYEWTGSSLGAGANYRPSVGGDTGKGGSGGGDGSSNTSEPNKPKEEAAETFDWLEVALQRLQEEQQKLDKVVKNTYTTWSDRNKSLTKEIKNITTQIEAEKFAVDEYKNYAESILPNGGKGLNDDDYGENDQLIRDADQKALDEANAVYKKYQELVKNGQMTGDDIEKINNKYIKEYINEFKTWWDKYLAAQEAVQDKEIELGDKYVERFNLVKTKYEQLIELIQDRADIINAKIERTEKKGFFVSDEYYKQLIANEKKQITKLEQQRDHMIQARDEAVASGAIKKNQEEWNNLTHEINGVSTAIENAKNEVLDFQNTMRQNKWDRLDWLEERIARITSSAQDMVELFSNNKLYEEDGRLTSSGIATQGLLAIQYQTNERQIAHYQSRLKSLSKQIEDDPSNKDLIAEYDRILDLNNDLVKANDELKDSYKNLVQEGINTHLSYLDKIIEKYQEVQDAEKEAYDYSKNISKQVKNINEIERMLTIYSGDDSEESRKNRQQLQTQLEEAKQNLEETEWDKAISESKKLVSQMREDYEEFLNKKLEDIEQLWTDGFNEIKGKADEVVAAINQEASDNGYTVTPELQKVLENAEKDDNLAAGVNDTAKEIKKYVEEMADKEDEDSKNPIKTVEEKRLYQVNQWKSEIMDLQDRQAKAETDAGSAKLQTSINKKYENAMQYIDKQQKAYDDTYSSLMNKKAKGIDVKSQLKELEAKQKELDKLKTSLRSLMGYAKGSSSIKKNQLAWTQEEGQELIFRSSDGAMLTPLGAGDMVFTNDMTKKLFDFASGNLPVLTMPNVPSTAGNNINNNNAISITLPNVQNYEQFKSEMKKDTRLQTWMQEVTLGQAIGNNTLRRNSL